MWGLCALVDQQTERPFSWSNCFTNPMPAFLCTLIMQKTHAYSRANHIISPGTPCKVILKLKGTCDLSGPIHRKYAKRLFWLHNPVNKRLRLFIKPVLTYLVGNRRVSCCVLTILASISTVCLHPMSKHTSIISHLSCVQSVFSILSQGLFMSYVKHFKLLRCWKVLYK